MSFSAEPSVLRDAASELGEALAGLRRAVAQVGEGAALLGASEAFGAEADGADRRFCRRWCDELAIQGILVEQLGQGLAGAADAYERVDAEIARVLRQHPGG